MAVKLPDGDQHWPFPGDIINTSWLHQAQTPPGGLAGTYVLPIKEKTLPTGEESALNLQRPWKT
ncbi:hypothetical protein LEMLEM_LOCUS11782 [Lemmus lemmus]